jgi:hypothetical protein
VRIAIEPENRGGDHLDIDRIQFETTMPGHSLDALEAKGIAKRVRGRTRTEHVGRLGETLYRRSRDLAMHRPVVLDFDPGLCGFVEKIERQVREALEHLHQASFESGPKGLLLAILVGAVGKRPFVDDPQPQEALGHFVGHHRWAVVGQKSTG